MPPKKRIRTNCHDTKIWDFTVDVREEEGLSQGNDWKEHLAKFNEFLMLYCCRYVYVLLHYDSKRQFHGVLYLNEGVSEPAVRRLLTTNSQRFTPFKDVAITVRQTKTRAIVPSHTQPTLPALPMREVYGFPAPVTIFKGPWMNGMAGYTDTFWTDAPQKYEREHQFLKGTRDQHRDHYQFAIVASDRDMFEHFHFNGNLFHVKQRYTDSALALENNFVNFIFWQASDWMFKEINFIRKFAGSKRCRFVIITETRHPALQEPWEVLTASPA